MKCSLHPDIDAIGVCCNCGKGLCSQCKVELAGKLYCQSCADEVFTKGVKSAEVSASYYVLPLFFGLVGGLIAYFVNDNHKKNRNRAKNMLGLGIIVSILWFIPILIRL
jgi:hypothetical protein